MIVFTILNISNFNNNKNEKYQYNNYRLNNLSKKIHELKIITNNNENEYKGMLECLINDPDEKNCIYHLISPKSVVGKKRILIGEKSDGCYVLLDDFSNIKIAYSFGIGSNVKFDKALADKGIDVYMYDHMINSLPYENIKFHWNKIGLSERNQNNINLKTLEQLIKENGHLKENNMILKIDIEHSEWKPLNTIKEDILKKFKYIVLEYHFKDEKYFKNQNIYYNVLKKISKTHQSFYVRCNGKKSIKINFGYNRICPLLEISYIIKTGNTFTKDDAIYPMYEFDFSIPEKDKSELNLNILKLFDK